MSIHEGCDIETARISETPRAQQRPVIPDPHWSSCRDTRGKRAPRQTAPKCLPKGGSGSPSSWKPGTPASERRSEFRGCRSGATGQQRVCGNQPHAPDRVTSRTGGHRSEPPHRASHPGQGRYRQPAQPPFPAAPSAPAAYAPRGNAVADRRQPPPLAGGRKVQVCPAASWMTPPAQYPLPCSAGRRTLQATSCSWAS